MPVSPAPAAAAEGPAAEEPPATPATAPTSPAPPAPGATPTGLGLSTLLPLSPSPPLAFLIQVGAGARQVRCAQGKSMHGLCGT